MPDTSLEEITSPPKNFYKLFHNRGASYERQSLQMVPYQHDMEKYRIDIDNFVKLTRK
jgi:hypothetical protein